MFIPSESVLCRTLRRQFDDLVQKAQRLRVMIVSPTLLMLAIQVIKQMRKDAQMREAADQIRTEVGLMIEDVVGLPATARKISNRTFGNQSNADIDAILISTGKIEKRGGKIAASVEFRQGRRSAEIRCPVPVTRKLGTGE